MTNEMNPCPFCGSLAAELIVDEDEWEIARVECRRMACRASGPHVNLGDFLNLDEAREAAVDGWNMRFAQKVQP